MDLIGTIRVDTLNAIRTELLNLNLAELRFKNANDDVIAKPTTPDTLANYINNITPPDPSEPNISEHSSIILRNFVSESSFNLTVLEDPGDGLEVASFEIIQIDNPEGTEGSVIIQGTAGGSGSDIVFQTTEWAEGQQVIITNLRVNF